MWRFGFFHLTFRPITMFRVGLICEWAIVLLPVSTPDVPVIDFNQTFRGHLVKAVYYLK